MQGASSGSFPADDDLVSDDFMTSCSIIASSHWEKIGTLLRIGSNRIDEIREGTTDNTTREKKSARIVGAEK